MLLMYTISYVTQPGTLDTRNMTTKERFSFDPVGHKYELDGKPMMGVTTVLNSTLAKPALIGWAAKMTAEWIRENCGRVEAHGNDWWVSEEELQEAVKAHNRKKEAGGASGKDTHALIEEYVKTCIGFDGIAHSVETNDPSLKSFIQWAVENRVKFLASEERMYSKDWWTAGTADLILEMGGKTYIGDVKTQAKLWDNTPHVQCAAYAKMREEMGKGKVDGTIIILIPRETSKVETHLRYNLDGDIKAFEACLLLYKTIPIQ